MAIRLVYHADNKSDNLLTPKIDLTHQTSREGSLPAVNTSSGHEKVPNTAGMA